MEGFFKLLFAILIVTIIISGCVKIDDKDDEKEIIPFEVITPENPQDKADRFFGINISESEQGFDYSYNKVKEAGIDVVEINLEWRAMEVDSAVYEDPFGILEATTFYANENLKVAFSLAVINTVSSTFPEYLGGYAYNSPIVINAFKNLLDWFMNEVPENLSITSLAIGNEVDLVLDGDEWNIYTDFYDSIATYINSNYSDIPVGVKTTVMNGFINELDEVKRINELSDVIMLNYYPQNSIFQVLETNIVFEHFDDVTEEFNDKEIWFTELGYQSGSFFCHSSEDKQAEFYHNVFTAWDNHKDQIKLIIIDWLHDQSPETVGEWEVYYGSSDPGFVEYLSSLGLRNHDGTDKNAWIQVKTEANTRGWD